MLSVLQVRNYTVNPTYYIVNWFNFSWTHSQHKCEFTEEKLVKFHMSIWLTEHKELIKANISRTEKDFL